MNYSLCSAEGPVDHTGPSRQESLQYMLALRDVAQYIQINYYERHELASIIPGFDQYVLPQQQRQGQQTSGDLLGNR